MNLLTKPTLLIRHLSIITVNCSLVYTDPAYTFGYIDDKTACYDARNIYSSKDISILAMTGLFNFATIMAVRRTTESAKNISGELSAKRLMELNLLKQAVAQAAAFAMQILCVAFLVGVIKSKWAVWAFTAVAWNLLHLVDPLIIITFNKGFRKLIRHRAKPLSTALHLAFFHTRRTTTL